MTNADFFLDPTASAAQIKARLEALHIRYHAEPRNHVRVHVRWMREHWSRKAYVRAAFHAFAGLVVAGPASLVQRYTGLVVPAFDAKAKS